MIAILLCTYNGEKFLSQQLDSLLNQTNKDYIVYIHDDGSTDTTLKIIKSYTTSYPDQFTFVDDAISHRGAGSSFMWLLGNIDADYYMFCDQDDVWLETKVEHTFNRIRELEKLHPNIPILIHTDLTLVDAYLAEIYPSFWKFQNFKVDLSKRKEYICFGNIVTGCTMIINKHVKQYAFPYNNYFMHDYWLALKTAKYGLIDNLKEQTILYRQHGNNEAGAGNKYNKHIIGIMSFFSGLKVEFACYKDLTNEKYVKWFFNRFYYFIRRHML